MGAGGDEETSNEIKEKESKNKRNYRADNCIFFKKDKRNLIEITKLKLFLKEKK